LLDELTQGCSIERLLLQLPKDSLWSTVPLRSDDEQSLAQHFLPGGIKDLRTTAWRFRDFVRAVERRLLHFVNGHSQCRLTST